MSIDTVFKVVGYQMKMPEGTFTDSVAIWVYANNAEEAINKAKSYGVEKEHWQILDVVEKKQKDK